MTIKVAIVGTGYFSRFHLDGWARLPEAKLVAVCSLDPAGLVDAAARYLIPRQFADVGEMLDAVKPDVLDIVTPPAAHLAVFGEAARRKVDVICQKPLGGDLETARAMVEMAKDAGITFVAHENFRFQPWYREARRLLNQGTLEVRRAPRHRTSEGGRRATRKPTLEEPEHYGAPTVDSPDFRSGRIGGAAGTVCALRVGASVIGASGEQKMSRMPRMLICLLAVLLMPWLNACNTARGMGEDIQALGRAMSGTAEDVEEDISAEPESPAEATTPSTPEPAPR